MVVCLQRIGLLNWRSNWAKSRISKDLQLKLPRMLHWKSSKMAVFCSSNNKLCYYHCLYYNCFESAVNPLLHQKAMRRVMYFRSFGWRFHIGLIARHSIRYVADSFFTPVPKLGLYWPQRPRQPAKLKPSYDPQQTWPTPRFLLLTST